MCNAPLFAHFFCSRTGQFFFLVVVSCVARKMVHQIRRLEFNRSFWSQSFLVFISHWARSDNERGQSHVDFSTRNACVSAASNVPPSTSRLNEDWWLSSKKSWDDWWWHFSFEMKLWRPRTRWTWFSMSNCREFDAKQSKFHFFPIHSMYGWASSLIARRWSVQMQ